MLCSPKTKFHNIPKPSNKILNLFKARVLLTNLKDKEDKGCNKNLDEPLHEQIE